MKRNNAALIGFLIALLIGLRVVAESAAAATAAPAVPAVGACASSQPELRKMFPIEMRMLKNFEGIWTDISYKKTTGLAQRTYVINSNKSKIQIQVDTKNDVGEVKTSQVMDAKVCKTENGLSLRAGDIDMPMLILSNKEVRFKVGNLWLPFFRIQEVHGSFFPPKDSSAVTTGDKAKPAAGPTGANAPVKTGTQ